MIDRPSDATLTLTLPDGSQRSVPAGTLPAEVVKTIGERLLLAAVAVEIDGQIQDLMTPLRASGTFRVLTDRDRPSLDVLRHSAAHILATAVRRLRPDAKIGFGPSIDEGFYYDFEVAEPFTTEDVAAFENEMRKVAAEKYPFVRDEVNRSQAQQRFADDPLKLERLSELADDEVISTYTDGPFIDLCRGPHVPDTSRLKHFKLTHTAGAYWRGDSKRQMLQRIYGTAFFKKEELDAYLHQIEEAKRRDHRVVGKQLDLFMMHHFAPGAVFWTERGSIVYSAIVDFVRERQRDDYHEVRTPLLFNKSLWEISGHWGKYRENMFLVLDTESGEHDFSLKPMNCPSHYLLYLNKKHSYRELPLRYATFDVLHRNEVSGALSGLTRVRQFAQDDCHVFLTESQITAEVHRLVQFILEYYQTFGLVAAMRFATRPSVRIGSDELWDQAESSLRAALDATGMAYELKPGDGAFYGPKIDFDVTDSIGRSWQLGTIQLDYNNAERFDLTYVGEDNTNHRPGHHPPRGQRVVRAVHRNSDRAFRRRVSRVARAGTGPRAADHRRISRLRRTRDQAAARRRHPRAPRRSLRDAQVSRRRGRAAQGAVHARRGKARSRAGHRRRQRARRGQGTAAERGAPWRVRRARGARTAHAGAHVERPRRRNSPSSPRESPSSDRRRARAASARRRRAARPT